MKTPYNTLTATCIAGLLATAGMANAAVIADFSDGIGNQTTAVDQFKGIAGGGWTTAWGNQGSVSGVTTTVIDGTVGTPLNSGGDYLGLNMVGPGGTGTVGRSYGDFDAVDTATDSYKISWDFRAEVDIMAAGVGGGEDRFHFAGDSSFVTGSAPSNSWLIGMTESQIYAGNWYFIDNNGSTAWTEANAVNTGMAVVAGTVYSFDITVNPTTGTYDASVTNGTITFSDTDLTFRNGLTGAFDTASFGMAMGGDDLGTSANEMSIDSLHISAIPEPSSLLLLSFTGLMLIFRRRR